MTEAVSISDMKPSDGLDDGSKVTRTLDRVCLRETLWRYGFSRIEITDFIRSRGAPQISDAAEVIGRSAKGFRAVIFCDKSRWMPSHRSAA
ncbi:hypothetical protein ROLI_009420 [Roseobacter fucihabitans]|uniref:Uncharacterized protein n=1 Tax=Roseobacter fucihabitans TaxID=1537242 RepID=A0ABZ2BPE7_9RHOB|nr:hydroxymethylglutaryl-CoA lyase [Roseobacter litoralis]